MAPINDAINRRLRNRLPADDLAAINAPTGRPFLDPGEVAAPPNIPFEQQQEIALAEGLFRGTEQVGARRSQEYLRGLGGFITPEGQAAFAPRIDETGRPVPSALTFVPNGGFLPGFDMNERVREVGNAVKRRLEQLTGAVPSQPQFMSPVPALVVRGRFGT